MLNPFEIKRNLGHLWVRLKVRNIVTGGGERVVKKYSWRSAAEIFVVLRKGQFLSASAVFR